MVEANPPAIAWMLAHYPLSSKWIPGGNTGEVKGGKEGTGRPISICRLPRISVFFDRHSPTCEIEHETKFYLY